MSAPVPNFVPYCAYTMVELGGTEEFGLIASPRRTDGKGEFACGAPPSDPGWVQRGRFYALNPMVRPIPSYMSLICTAHASATPYNAIGMSHQYDPFDTNPPNPPGSHPTNEAACVNFIAWIEPTPYTTPLYVYKNRNGVFVSFERLGGVAGGRGDSWRVQGASGSSSAPVGVGHAEISPIYVLTDKPMPETIFPNGDQSKWFKRVDGVPQFRFSSYQGRCVPDPEGVPLDECSNAHNLHDVRPQSLLDHLRQLDTLKTSPIVKWIQSSWWLGAVILVVFLVSLFITIRELGNR